MERHRIHENFSQEMLDGLQNICNNPRYSDNNSKAKDMLFLLKEHGFTEIGPGTNRLTVRSVDYVYKIAMDSFGVRDNWNEFNMSPKAQPYVTKTYECNGLIAVAEYVNLITKQEFKDSLSNIKNMLEILAQDFIFCDMGLIEKNMLNFGFRDDGALVVLDYGLTK